jgi:hypothetical protein
MDQLPPQPRPLRIIAAIATIATLIVAGLPTFGVPLSAEQAGWLVGAVGALAAAAVALIGERQVTPVTSPRSKSGMPLVPALPPPSAPKPFGSQL